MNYEHNKNFGLFQFQSGYRKLYLNTLKGYSRKLINAQTGNDNPSYWMELFHLPNIIICNILMIYEKYILIG